MKNTHKEKPVAPKLWQHEETGRFVWAINPGKRWFEVPYMTEDELPVDLTDREHDAWHLNSMVRESDGLLVGPCIERHA